MDSYKVLTPAQMEAADVDGDGCTADGTPQNPAANHGATKGGFMYKFEKTGDFSSTPD